MLKRFLTVPHPKALKFALLVFLPIWFPSAFVERASFYIKINVYENEQINRHQLESLQGSGTTFISKVIFKEHYLFPILNITGIPVKGC